MIDTALCEFGAVGRHEDVGIHAVPPVLLQVHYANR